MLTADQIRRERDVRKAPWVTVACVMVLVGCWVFPWLWYTRGESDADIAWHRERTQVPGWRFERGEVGGSAEAILAADALFYGTYAGTSGQEVRLFTARRYRENPHEIGLFVHTPDRCWTEAGWTLEETRPDWREVNVGGRLIGVERRVFSNRWGEQELVYFFGMVGGETLPYRLDHNLGIGRRLWSDEEPGEGTVWRATSALLWRRLAESFWNRRRLLGPKEFVRISTPVTGGDLAGADAVLALALGELLERVSQSTLASVPKEEGGFPGRVEEKGP